MICPDLLILFLALKLKKKNQYNLVFNIKDNNKPIRNGYVCIRSMKTKRFLIVKTDSYGRAVVKNICSGFYIVKACADGYKDKFLKIQVCENRSYNLCLCKSKCDKNRIYGYIKDEKDKIIERALVVLYEVLGENKYNPVRFTYTDFTGEYNFIDVPEGKYLIKAIK